MRDEPTRERVCMAPSVLDTASAGVLKRLLATTALPRLPGRLAFPGDPCIGPVRTRSTWGSDLVGPHLVRPWDPKVRRSAVRSLPPPCVLRCRRHISQHPARCRAPRTETSKTAPPPTSPLESTPTSPRARFGRTLPSARHVPSSRFLPALTVSSSNDFVGLLHPTAGPGVHRVFAPRAVHACTTIRGVPAGVTPSRALPSPVRGATRHRGPCLRAVDRTPHGMAARPRGLVRTGSPLRLHTVAGVGRPWLSWASPLQSSARRSPWVPTPKGRT